MLKLSFAIMLFVFGYHCSLAQQKYPYWSVGFNPLSVGESMSAIGPTVAYRFSPRLELWSEGSVIFSNLYKLSNWQNLKGYRFILQPRYYVKATKTFFISPEFRLKQFSYGGSLDFINKISADTLKKYNYEGAQFLIGGALVLGKQFTLSARHQLFLELTAGLGAKQRTIKRKNIPAGYNYYIQPGGFGLSPHYEWDNDGTVYFPLGLRLSWHLK